MILASKLSHGKKGTHKIHFFKDQISFITFNLLVDAM
jgi:hypothetical protein